MKPKTLVSIFALTLAAMTSASIAQERSLTREGVKAELPRSMNSGGYELYSETAPGATWWDHKAMSNDTMSSGAYGRSYSDTSNSSAGGLTGDDARRQADELRRQTGFEGS